MNDITPIPVKLGDALKADRKSRYDFMQAQLKKAGESVKPASHTLYRVLELVEQYGSEELKEKVRKELNDD